MRRRELPPRRTIVALIAILFVAAFVVSRSCQHREVRIDQQRAIAIAREQIDYQPDRAAVRLIRRGVPSRAYWAVSLPSAKPKRSTTVVLSATTGKVVEVTRERP
jgi:uncharacterized membrane protein YkoI